MSDDDENDNGQNPIPEWTNLNINNFTLSQLHELRNAINIRIDELAPSPPVAMDLADALQLQNVVVAVRKTIWASAQQVEAVYAVALHNFGWMWQVEIIVAANRYQDLSMLDLNQVNAINSTDFGNHQQTLAYIGIRSKYCIDVIIWMYWLFDHTEQYLDYEKQTVTFVTT